MSNTGWGNCACLDYLDASHINSQRPEVFPAPICLTNGHSGARWTHTHTRTHTYFQSNGGMKWLNIKAITSRGSLLTLAGPGTACSACPSWCWGGWRTLGSSGPPEAGPQTPSPPYGPALPPPDPAACRCSPSPPVCGGAGGGHIEGMCIIYFCSINILTQRYTAGTNFTTWNIC